MEIWGEMRNVERLPIRDCETDYSPGANTFSLMNINMQNMHSLKY